MGVDYDGIGGIGIEFTECMAEKAIELGIFDKEDWEEDKHGCLDAVGIQYSEAGNSYSGDTRFYLLVEGNTLKEINDNAGEFVVKVSKLLPNLSADNLQVIADLYVW